jgi:hypothetical protein
MRDTNSLIQLISNYHEIPAIEQYLLSLVSAAASIAYNHGPTRHKIHNPELFVDNIYQVDDYLAYNA